MRSALVIILLAGGLLWQCQGEEPVFMSKEIPVSELPQSEEEWRQRLTPEQFRVLRQKGTEHANTGAFTHHKADGSYRCAACGQLLFQSDHKYDSGSGWPSFFELARSGVVEEIRDTSHGMVRTEVVCSRCRSHLGHVFDDGPQPSGRRYCINSLSLAFDAKVPRPAAE